MIRGAYVVRGRCFAAGRSRVSQPGSSFSLITQTYKEQTISTMCVYASDPLAYDFDQALTDARRRTKDRSERKWREFEVADRIYWLKEFPETPTPEGLRKHATRYGSEGVQEVADAYGLDLNATTKARAPKLLTPGKSKRATERALRALIPHEEGELVGTA